MCAAEIGKLRGEIKSGYKVGWVGKRGGSRRSGEELVNVIKYNVQNSQRTIENNSINNSLIFFKFLTFK